jgi:hypothetical protein
VNFPTPTVYFRAWDPDGGVLQPQNIVPTVMNREGSFYTAQQITIGTCQDETGCPETGGFKMLLSPVQNGNGAATVTLTVTDAEGLQGTSSFTMRKNSAAANPPLIANIPSESVELSKAGYGPVQFVIDDEDESGVMTRLTRMATQRSNRLRRFPITTTSYSVRVLLSII